VVTRVPVCDAKNVPDFAATIELACKENDTTRQWLESWFARQARWVQESRWCKQETK
jgi:hypothetical protein